MVSLKFPPVNLADTTGLLALGGNLEPDTLLTAYKSGIFVWPPEDDILAWFSPDPRAILKLDNFKLSDRDQRSLKKKNFTFKINTDFKDIITACAELKNRGSQNGTWIIPELIDAYYELHLKGYCHSVATYLDGKLVGGLYGVAINGFFAGESMFYREALASKAALNYLVTCLLGKNCKWIDCQVMTPLFASLGAELISRSEYLKLLEAAISTKVTLFN